MEITKELRDYMRKFQNEFGDIVPLREMPEGISSEQIIDAIKTCLEKNENLLPVILGYGELEKDKSIFI